MNISSIRAGKVSLIIIAVIFGLYSQLTDKTIIPLSPQHDNSIEQKSSRISTINSDNSRESVVEDYQENIGTDEKSNDNQANSGKETGVEFDQSFLTYEELVKVKGIGDKTARSILAYLSSKKISSLDELIDVKGIGVSKLKAIKDYFNNK